MTTYAQHALSAAFPSMSADDQQALTNDIETNGQREPIVMFEGAVLDGWHRYQACLSLGLAPVETALPADTDPVAYVKSRNLHRRHLSASQRAAAVVACSDWAPAHRPNKSAVAADLPEKSLHDSNLRTTQQMAKEANVGVRTVEHAKAAHKAGLGEAVRDGTVTAERAAEVAKMPKAKRKAALAEPKAAKKAKPAVKSAAQQQRDQIAADAHGDFDPLAELEATQKEVDRLSADLAATEADDLKAEVLKWRRAHQVAERRQSELMDAASAAQKHSKFLAGQLQRCGRAVGETDPDKIAATVEAFVRASGKKAA